MELGRLPRAALVPSPDASLYLYMTQKHSALYAILGEIFRVCFTFPNALQQQVGKETSPTQAWKQHPMEHSDMLVQRISSHALSPTWGQPLLPLSRFCEKGVLVMQKQRPLAQSLVPCGCSEALL